MAFRILMRGGVYGLFIVGVLITWLMKKAPKQQNRISKKSLQTEMSQDEALLALKNPDWHMRLSAVQALSRYPSDQTLAALLLVVGDIDPDIREIVGHVIEAYQSTAVPGLISLLDHEENIGREAAVQILGRIADQEATLGIIQALQKDESAWVRISAVEQLGKIHNLQSTTALIQALQDEHPDVNRAVRKALEAIGTPKALQAIQEKHSRTVDNPSVP